MKYTYNKITYMIPDKEVDKLMDSLDISLAEACEMWLCDNDKIKDKKQEELTEKAQKNRITATIHSAKGEKKERKAPVRKENPTKQEIINTIFAALKEKYGENDTIRITNIEKYIDFSIENQNFTINLVMHREKKS